MKIMIFGAAGDVGQRFVKEAVSRGHKVSAFIRNAAQAVIWADEENVDVVVGDLQHMTDLEQQLDGYDFILSALRPPEGQEDLLISLTAKVIALGKAVNLPVLVVGGAASLKIPNTEYTVLTAPDFLPASVVPIATACQAQYEMCLQVKDVAWTYLSPSAMLMPGERSGNYRIETDQLVTDEAGNSSISMEDFAVAALDEVENRKYIQKRFTAGY